MKRKMHMFEICSKKAIFFCASHKKNVVASKDHKSRPSYPLSKYLHDSFVHNHCCQFLYPKKSLKNGRQMASLYSASRPPPQLRLRFVTLRGIPPLPWAQLWISPSMVPGVPNWVTVGTLYGIYLRLMIWWCWRMINCDCTGTVAIDSWCIKFRSLGNTLKYFYYLTIYWGNELWDTSF